LLHEYITQLDLESKLLKDYPDNPETLEYIDRFVKIAQYFPAAIDDEAEIEAAYIYKNGDYYLFVNWGACCSGLDWKLLWEFL
jgi:hypothetical protein